MKFMTPATLRNLPNYMQEDRQRLLMDREDEALQKADQEKQAFMDFSVDLWKLGSEVKDPEELNQRMGELAGKYRGVLPPTAMQHAAQYVQKWSDNFQQKQEKEEGRLLKTQGNASDQALVDAIRGSNTRGGDEFSVPMTDDDYFNPHVMDPEDQMSLLKYRDDKKSAQTKALLDHENRQSENELRDARIRELNRRGTGVAGEGKKYSPQELALKKLEYVDKATDGMGSPMAPEEYQAARQAAGDEFDAAMGVDQPDTDVNPLDEILGMPGVLEKEPENTVKTTPPVRDQAIDPKLQDRSEPRYEDAKIVSGYVWANDSNGNPKRLFKVEPPEVKYGNKTYPNPKYKKYLESLKSLGISE